MLFRLPPFHPLQHTNSSFGYGFVNFVSKEDADRAIEVKDGEKVLHKQIRVAYSR